MYLSLPWRCSSAIEYKNWIALNLVALAASEKKSKIECNSYPAKVSNKQGQIALTKNFAIHGSAVSHASKPGVPKGGGKGLHGP